VSSKQKEFFFPSKKSRLAKNKFVLKKTRQAKNILFLKEKNITGKCFLFHSMYLAHITGKLP
jgi:hypothetical protein